MTGRERIWIGGLAAAILAGLPTLVWAQSERLPGGIERVPDNAAPVARGLRGAPPQPSTALPPPAPVAPAPAPAAIPTPAPKAPAPKSDKSGAVPKAGTSVAQALDPKDGKAPKPPKVTAPQAADKATGGPAGSGAPRAAPADAAPPASRGLSGGASERKPGGIERVPTKD